jgi:GNAT superfamily N-acetyltransferase
VTGPGAAGEAGVRPRDDGDMAGCVALLRRVHERDGYPLAWPADPAGWLTGSRQVAAWVAGPAEAISGHVALARAGSGAAAAGWAAELGAVAADVLCIRLLFVDPRQRGRGTGAALLATALAGARARGAPAALEVISLNRDAIALYRSGGWRQVGEISYDWLPAGERSLLFVPPAA